MIGLHQGCPTVLCLPKPGSVHVYRHDNSSWGAQDSSPVVQRHQPVMLNALGLFQQETTYNNKTGNSSTIMPMF